MRNWLIQRSRFRLRTMLVVITVVSWPLSILGVAARDYRQEREILGKMPNISVLSRDNRRLPSFL